MSQRSIPPKECPLTSAKQGETGEFSSEVILDAMLSGVLVVDTNWVVRYSNQSAIKMLGTSRQNIINHSWQSIFRSDVCDVSRAVRQLLDSDGDIIQKQGYLASANHQPISVAIATVKLWDEGGRLLGAVAEFSSVAPREPRRRESQDTVVVGEIISRSPLMVNIIGELPIVASSPSTILIQGETGTGKELLARTIHQLSPRNAHPFVAVNCCALPDTLLESELFGYKAGAFTGADRDKPGRFLMARGGTLFLDEIGDMPLPLQVKLLRVLQERVYEPLGAVKPEPADVRIIAASNRDIYQLVQTKEFRRDLYYRLNVMKIVVPPLRYRREDIPIVIRQFIAKYNKMQGKSIQDVSPDVMGIFMAHNWPGNIRELENIIERAFILCSDGFIEKRHLPNELTMGTTAPAQLKTATPLHDAHNILDMQTINSALENNNNNRAAAAKQLRIHKTTLFRRMKKLGIQVPRRQPKKGAP